MPNNHRSLGAGHTKYLLFHNRYFKSQPSVVINTHMTNNTTDLEKIVKEQAKQIESLKKAVSGLQQQLTIMSKKLNRTYETGRKSANDINNITGILRRNG